MKPERMAALILAAGTALNTPPTAPGFRLRSTQTPAGGRLLVHRRKRDKRNRTAKRSRRINRKGGR